MEYLALSILASSLIFVIFKLYARYGVQTLYAIIVNYFIACSVGLYFYQGKVTFSTTTQRPWFMGTLALGILFIIVFNLMAATSQKIGVSAASVATKMSLAIPVVFGVWMYGERLGLFEILGILLALVAVYLATMRKKTIVEHTYLLLLPIAVFIGSGIIDTSIKYAQQISVPEEEFPLFSAMVFGSAATCGTLFVLVMAVKNGILVNLKNVLGGICLGVPNYFSIYFLMKALDSDTLNSASIFTINNVAIVMCSTFLGILLFRERISSTNWFGIGLAIVSIILVALGTRIEYILLGQTP